MRHLHFLEFEYAIDYELTESVRRHFPLDWSEDAITHDLVIRLRRRFNRTHLTGMRFPVVLEWEVYKLRGLREQSHGDIGWLFRHGLPSGDVLEGAGFMEAKLRARDSNKFTQIRKGQVKRILKRSPETLLLLYDYNAVPVLDSEFVPEPGYDFGIHRWASTLITHARVTHGPVVPLQLAAAVGRYDDTLYRFGYSLAQQVSRRYLHLHDLDFSQSGIADVKGYPGGVGSPNWVMVIRVAQEGQAVAEGSGLNQDVYEALE
jgi:hypothetical protein